MNKKGAGLISIFLCTLLIFCSFSFPAYAVNEWGYNDSYINSVSSENGELFFLPLAPESSFTDYLVLYWHDDYYLVLGSGDFLLFGSGYIQSPSHVSCYIYEPDSNTWEVSSFPDNYHGLFPGFYPGKLTVIDCTSNLHYWGLGTPVQEKPIVNYTGYRLYWNLALILIKSLCIVDYFADYIMQHELVKYLFVTAFAGELFIFLIILFRRIGEMRSEEVNL